MVVRLPDISSETGKKGIFCVFRLFLSLCWTALRPYRMTQVVGAIFSPTSVSRDRDSRQFFFTRLHETTRPEYFLINILSIFISFINFVVYTNILIFRMFYQDFWHWLADVKSLIFLFLFLFLKNML